jgi:hypothetical protein
MTQVEELIERLRSRSAIAPWRPASDAKAIAEAADALASLQDRVARLERGLTTIFHGDEPRPIGERYADDGSPSKHDKCTHDRYMWEDCTSCVAEFASAVLRGEEAAALQTKAQEISE